MKFCAIGFCELVSEDLADVFVSLARDMQCIVYRNLLPSGPRQTAPQPGQATGEMLVFGLSGIWLGREKDEYHSDPGRSSQGGRALIAIH